ncbi:MAG TPA: lysylphosphatidylglycerol synthase domain-containing protein [Methylomirabilota bacterium]
MADVLRSPLVGTVLGVLAAAALIAWLGPEDVLASARRVELADVVVYLGLTACTYLLRAWRFRALISRAASLPKLYGIVSLHTLLVNLLPFSAGDLSYPVLLKRFRISRDLVDGIPSLLVVRLQDVFITGALVPVALIWLGHGPRLLEAAEPRLPLTLLGLAAAAVAAVLLGGRLARTPLVRRVAPAVGRIWSDVRGLHPRVWLATLALGFLVRLIAIVAVSYLFRSVGIPLSLATVLLITTLYTLLPLLPVNVVAGIGVTEAFLVICFVASGIDRGVAAAASLQIHGLQLLTAGLLAGTGALQLWWASRS